MVSKGYISYKHTNSIISQLLYTLPRRQEIFFDFCKLQVEVYANSDTMNKAKSFDNSRKAEKLEVMFTSQPGYFSVYSNGSDAKKS